MISVFSYGFIALITLISVANIFNTISTNMNLRRREFAMLRSVGMTPKSFNRMIYFESLFYGLKALLYGLPAALLLSVLMAMSIASGITGIGVLIPWAHVGICIAGVLLIVFVTMKMCIRDRDTILLTEDDQSIAMGLIYSLTQENFTVLHCKTVEESLQALTDTTVALAILDITLPDGNGYDICRKIRETSDIPAVSYTHLFCTAPPIQTDDRTAQPHL